MHVHTCGANYAHERADTCRANVKGALLSLMEGRYRAMWNVGVTSTRLALLNQQMGSPVSTCNSTLSLPPMKAAYKSNVS